MVCGVFTRVAPFKFTLYTGHVPVVQLYTGDKDQYNVNNIVYEDSCEIV